MRRSTNNCPKPLTDFNSDTYSLSFVLSVSKVLWVFVLGETVPSEFVDEVGVVEELGAVVTCLDVIVV